MRSKFAGLFILFCLTTPLIATYTWLQYRKRLVNEQVKRQLRSGLDDKELAVLKFSRQDARLKLRWEGPEEFEYEGQMYDVASVSVSGDTLVYRCWWDHEEARLNQHLQDLIAYALGKDAQNKENRKRLAKFFRSLYCPQVSLWPALSLKKARQQVFTYAFHRPPVFLPPPAPPPEMLSPVTV